MPIAFSVFTKPWHKPIPELGALVKELGFDAIELPVRPGYAVEPGRIEQDLPTAVRQLADLGVHIASIAGSADERTIAASAQSGVPLIRTMVQAPPERGYREHEAMVQRHFEALVPCLDRYDMKLGVQNHSGQAVFDGWGFLRFFDVSNPASPVQIGTFATVNTNNEAVATTGTYSVHNPEVRGNKVYGPWYNGGVRIIDTSKPSAPNEIGSWTGEGLPADWPRVDIWSVIPHRGLLFASDRNGGLILKERG